MLVFRLSGVLDKPFKLVQTIIFPHKHAVETRRRKKKGTKKILRVTNKLRMEGHMNGEENKERTV